jgi:hypothetical protein
MDLDELVERKGLTCTCAVRTVCDLAWRLPFEEAVGAVDMALHGDLVGLADLELAVDARANQKGVKRQRRILGFADGRSESPMETRLRLLLVLAGLPKPDLQVRITAEDEFLARADLFYPNSNLVIEYDGSTHKSSLVEDSRRQNRLINAGYRVLRFTAADVLNAPDGVIAQVTQALTA